MIERNPRYRRDADIHYPADSLGMDPEEMRRLGHKVVDLVVDRLLQKHDEPALVAGEPSELMAALGGALPEAAPRARRLSSWSQSNGCGR
jgi:hypothetical protein